MSNCSIQRALPVVTGTLNLDPTNATAFGIGELLMYSDGTNDSQGNLVFHKAEVNIDDLRDLIWMGGSGTTRITVPDLGLKGELVANDGTFTFNGVTYTPLPEEFEDYVLVGM